MPRWRTTTGSYANDPARRLDGRAARCEVGRGRRSLARTPSRWPADSPGSCNAWLLFVTTKPPTWRDPLHPWVERPLTLGEPHEGFLYPDPIGFWDEVRRWAVELFRLQRTHVEHRREPLAHHPRARRRRPGPPRPRRETCAQPRTIVFLDEPAWQSAALDVATTPFSVPDPHRAGQVYEGWWGTTADGAVVGKSPQHPTMHRLYRAEDLTAWLRAAPGHA